MELEVTGKFAEALELLEGGEEPLFITGRAGTGKSTLLKHFCERSRGNVAVLAPTGVAALNIHGETIHSFFGFKPSINEASALKKGRAAREKPVYRKLNTLVIDEISMVRADLLDCVDAFLRGARRNSTPFGGVRTVFIGDVFQLPPVVAEHERGIFETEYASPYFFSARVMERGFQFRIIELDKIHRQKDSKFINVLNAIRDGSPSDEHLSVLNARVGASWKGSEGAIVLTTTNAMADRVNEERLARLSGRVGIYQGKIAGQFNEKQRPTEQTLYLKPLSQVMFLNNDREGRWVNGTLGHVVETRAASVIVRIPGKGDVEVLPHSWAVAHYVVRAETGSLELEDVGTFTQLPLRLAWAVTIHKSQGKTFDEVRVDFGGGTFAHGQAYVALSRCRTLEGLSLVRPFRLSDIRLDPRVAQFLNGYSYAGVLNPSLGF